MNAIKEIALEILDEDRESLKESLRLSVKKGFETYLQSTWDSPIKKALDSIVEKWITDNFTPMLAEELERVRPEMLELFASGCRAQILLLQEGLSKAIMSKMENNWQRNEFFSQLFKGN